MKTVAIILAAGSGKRMQADINKQFLSLGGQPVLARTLAVFQACAAIDGIILVAKAEEVAYCREAILAKGQYDKVLSITAGGAERQDSVYQGLLRLPHWAQWVVIHDGARPLVTDEEITRTVEAATAHCGAVLGAPAKDTIKRVDQEQLVQETPPRAYLWQVFTPQVFAREQIMDAYHKARREGYRGTDDASLVEYAGGMVKMVQGSYGNLKITTPEDLLLAEAILRHRGEAASCSA